MVHCDCQNAAFTRITQKSSKQRPMQSAIFTACSIQDGRFPVGPGNAEEARRLNAG